jgi:catechol 2,3-dioxygenase-like lactoylglutathione lyase family enzyme
VLTAEESMRIRLTTVLVDDQDKALRFYTDLLGVQEETRHSGRRISVDHRDVAGGLNVVERTGWAPDATTAGSTPTCATAARRRA